jgi:methionine-rich copper-binding protein CopC
MRVPFRFLAGLALSLILLAGAARAHAILVFFKIDGQDVVLQYNDRIDVNRSRLTLMTPDSSAVVKKLEGAAGNEPAQLKAHIEGVPPGSYVLRWEVLSVDGHISRGDQPLVLPAP